MTRIQSKDSERFLVGTANDIRKPDISVLLPCLGYRGAIVQRTGHVGQWFCKVGQPSLGDIQECGAHPKQPLFRVRDGMSTLMLYPSTHARDREEKCRSSSERLRGYLVVLLGLSSKRYLNAKALQFYQASV